MTDYPNWFAGIAQENFEKFLSGYSKQQNLAFLQVGAFTGDASKWMLDNILTGRNCTLTDVDTWQGSDEGAHHAMDFNDVEFVYDRKMAGYENSLKYKMKSDDFFHKGLGSYDFIYIDGDHTADQTYRDGCNGWNNLKQGGILAFDDYTWGMGLPDQTLAPQPGIDKFLEERNGQYELLEHGAQIWIRKN